VFERVSGRDLSAYRTQLVEGTARLDWSVVSAVSRREEDPEGVFDREGRRMTLERERPRGKGSDEKGSFVTVVRFGNLGEWAHGTQARLVFRDGTVLDRELPAEAKWVRFTIRSRSRLAWAAVDPARRNPWEWDRFNDSKVIGRGRGAAATQGQLAAVKYFGWTAYLAGLLTQLLWALA
jgi:hypothetical protein